MQAERTRYTVPGWGVGELWTSEKHVLVHDFAFTPVSDTDVVATGGTPQTDRVEPAGPAPFVPRSLAGSPCGKIGTNPAHLALDRNRCLTPEELHERFRAFLAGDNPDLHDIALDLSWATPFQHAVAASLRAVPRGEVVSYGELAALAGYPGAHRAVGTFCARNRFAFLVPCHRVVGADGIGGYGSAGVAVKRRLLGLENVVL